MALLSKLKRHVKNYLKLQLVKISSARVYENPSNSSELQCLLKNQYRLLKSLCKPSDMPSLDDVGFKAFSQFEEDGILLYIFFVIGTTNKRVVEICAGNGRECMSANLIINHGWEGLLFDGDIENVNSGMDFYRKHPSTFLYPPIFKQAWLTAENVNELIKSNGFSGEIDLLSLDIDGNDYWVLKAITSLNPRLIICETNDVIPSNLALTIPHNPNFCYKNLPEDKHDFRSASLLAMKKLCSEKGYRLIGSHRYGFNVIFMRNDIGLDYFPEVSIEEIHNNPQSRYYQSERWPKVKDMPWVEV
jgi:hypothetical protein